MTQPKPRQFTDQNKYYDKYFHNIYAEEFNKTYNTHNYKKNEKPQTQRYWRRLPPENINDTLKKYPSLKKSYEQKSAEFLAIYHKHKSYFHNNVFEEIMMRVWHYKNADRFESWDPSD
jgi:hypothetical protein